MCLYVESPKAPRLSEKTQKNWRPVDDSSSTFILTGVVPASLSGRALRHLTQQIVSWQPNSSRPQSEAVLKLPGAL